MNDDDSNGNMMVDERCYYYFSNDLMPKRCFCHPDFRPGPFIVYNPSQNMCHFVKWAPCCAIFNSFDECFKTCRIGGKPKTFPMVAKQVSPPMLA